MECPKCHESMFEKIYQEKDYRLCVYCQGSWVPAKSLTSDLELVSLSVQADSAYNCPQCQDSKMVTAMAAEIELELCLACTGIFFDKNELERLDLDFTNKDYKSAAADTWQLLKAISQYAREISTVFNAFRPR